MRVHTKHRTARATTGTPARATTRATTRTTALAAVAAAALSLGLTACGGGGAGTGAKDAGAATSATAATPSAAAPADPAATTAPAGTTAAPAAATSTTHSSGSGSSASSASSGSSGSSGGTDSAAAPSKAPACAHGDVRITAAKADEVPTEHIVLTATNTSGRTCVLLGHPLLAFGEIQTAKDVPPVAKSRPATPVVLRPGAPAYANVRISLGGVHEDNKVVKEFNVNLFAADGPAEGSVVVKAPAGGIAVDEAVARTGYWTPELRNGADDF